MPKTINVVFLSAVLCGFPPEVDSEVCTSSASQVVPDVVSGLYPYLTEVDYSCLGDRKFYDGFQTKTVVCSSDAFWTVTCIGQGWNYAIHIKSPGIPEIGRAHV